MRPSPLIRSSAATLIALGLALACGATRAAPQGLMPDDPALFNRPMTPQAAARRLLGMGFNALRKKDYLNAEKLLLRARRIEPQNPYILLNLGVLFYQTQRPRLAREAWSAILLAPESATGNAVITSSPDVIGESPAAVARRNLQMLETGPAPESGQKP